MYFENYSNRIITEGSSQKRKRKSLMSNIKDGKKWEDD
jgi:hypothetical protein